MPEPLSIGEVAELLDRRVATVRKWDREGSLPDHLKPVRGERNWRHWDRDQVEGLRAWADRRVPGSALVGYTPDAERMALHRSRMRGPRPKGRRNDGTAGAEGGSRGG